MRFFFTLLLLGFVAVLMAQPANDDCANAITVPSIEGYCSGVDEFTTTDATTSTGYGTPAQCSPTWDGDQNDVWFVFSTTSTIIDLTITVNGATMQQPQIAVYRGSCAAFAELACAQGAVDENSASLDLLALDPSETYYLRINAATTGSDGDFQLCIDEFNSNVITNITTNECTGLLYDSGGPNGQYGAFENFAYTICPSNPHDCIAVTVASYDIEPIFDNLSIYDGSTADPNNLVESIDGESMGNQEFVTVETTGCITIGFTSDGGMFRDGFELTWECTQGGCPPPPPDFITCSGTFYDSGGPDGEYANDEMETYIICPDSAYTCLELTFLEYDVESSLWDQLNVYEGSGTDGMLLATLSGIGMDATFHNEGCFTVEFMSDDMVTKAGWEATWQCTQDACPPDGTDLDFPDLTDCSGTFYDSGGPSGNYLNNEDWDFSVCPDEPNLCIIININTYDLPADGDVLTLYDGPDTTGDVLGRYFLTGANVELQTPSSCFTIAFESNTFVTSGGWDISWQCSTDSCTLDIPIDVFTDVSADEMGSIIAADGVIISNVTLNCPNGAFGTFQTNGECNLGMESGIILTNGSATAAEGPDGMGNAGLNIGAVGDADLDSLLVLDSLTYITQDACVLEFDIYASTDILSFNYSFGSEEYPEFAPPSPTMYNDVFGFFISGPGISGPFNGAENIALIPGTNTPVSIVNINAVTNNSYYITNEGGLCVEYDAFTSIFTASAQVTPCETYHIKLAIADVGDGAFDSGVFIEAQSLSTGIASISPPRYEFSPNVDLAIEGCSDGAFTVSLSAPEPDATIVYLDVTGTATNGVDFAEIPDSLIFAPGETEITVPVVPVVDNMDEGAEELIVYITTLLECGNVRIDSTVINIRDDAEITFLPESPITLCENDTIQIKANGAVSYQWSTGAGTALVTVIPTESTTYNVSGIIGDCTFEDSIEVIISELDIQIESINISCLTDVGTLLTDVSGGVAPYAFNWDTPVDSTIQNPSNLPEGTYNLFVTDASGCTGTASAEIMVLNDFIINIEQDTSGTCAANTEASVVIVSQPEGDFDLTYEWDDGQSTAIAVGLSGGSHDVTVTLSDSNGNICTQTASVMINAMGSFDVNVIATPENCGGITGTINVEVTGGTPPFEYSIGGATSQMEDVFTGVSAGNYTVVVQDAEGCVVSTQAIVDNAPMPMLTANVDETSCDGSNGAITLMASEGDEPYQYSIDNCMTFQNSPTFTDLPAGEYSICVRDATQCEATNTVTILESNTPQITTASSNLVTTCGDANGLIIIEVTGGVQNYEYSIDDGATYQSENTFSDLVGGDYAIVVRDAVGCTASESLTIAASTGPSFDDVIVENASFCGTQDGSILIESSGGVPPLQYSNNNGLNYQTSPIFTGFGAGTYPVIVADSEGCADTLIVNLTEPASPSLDSMFVANPMCGMDNGVIELYVRTGTPNFEYSIDDGLTFQGSNTFENLPAGTYDIVIVDFIGCRFTTMLTLTQAGAPEPNLDVTPATCGDTNGVINLNPTNGTAPYSYSIDGVNFQPESTFFNLSPATYTVTVEDAAGCVTEVITNIITTGPIIIGDMDATDPTTCDVSDGAIQIFVNGGTPPYEFSIDNGANYSSSALFTDLDAGTYNIIIKDVNGCVGIEMVTLTEYDNPQITDIQIEDTPCDENLGTITIFAEGGTPNYQYSIDGGNAFQGSNIFENISGGMYDVIVEDFTGCQVTMQISVNGIGAPEISDVSTVDPSCGENNGSITITATGGMAGYEYSIDNGATFQNSMIFNDLAGGTYDIVVRDANACDSYMQITLMDNGAVNISMVNLNNSICDGENGEITVNAEGGTSPYQYSIDGGANFQSGNVFSGLPPGTYNVLVEDVNGCQMQESVTLISAGAPTLNIISMPATCGSTDGMIEITATGGTPDYQYSVDNGNTFQNDNTFTNLAAGTYEVLVEDALGCQTTEQIEISATMGPIPQITTDGPTDFCFDENITLNAGQYASYEWSSGQETATVTTNTAGTYFVTVTDDDGCTGIGEITLTVTPEFMIDGGEDMTVDLGSSFDLNVEPDNADYIYTWVGEDGNLGGGAEVTFIANEAGTFTYTVTADLNGCKVTDEVRITVEDRSRWEIPNAFSPNGDDLNDTFYPVLYGSAEVIGFKVFNRWGELVHNNASMRWDGTFRGEQQAQENYTYLIVIQTGNNDSEEITGSILLIR